ncbi:CsbD family protein [Bacillus sp. 1P06AnD]|uniref:CsbD family protein n=1 Tax=Bacillus sp. 1P06AnD TaxID=3132208 RepID=UPI00399F7ABC
MSNSLSDKTKGAVNKAKGEFKDQYGNLTNDTSLQAEGKKDKMKGTAQQKVGEAKDRFHEDR